MKPNRQEQSASRIIGDPAFPLNSGSFFSSGPALPAARPVPLKYLIIPCLVFVFISTAGGLVFHIDAIKVRPWLTFPVFAAVNLCFVCLTLYYGITACRKFGFDPLFDLSADFGLVREFFKSLGLMFCINICIILPVAALSFLLQSRMKPHTIIDLTRNMPVGWGLICLLILAFTLIPVVEEIFFRGFVYNALKTRMTAACACFLQALLFAACHPYGIIGNFYIFLFGAALAVVYEKKKNLIRPVFIHCLKNGLVLIPLIFVSIGNLADPAESYESARVPPPWLSVPQINTIERQSSGAKQLDHALKTADDTLFTDWKLKARAFAAVPRWFAEDAASSSRAQLHLISIYHKRLGDYWRVIATARQLKTDYPQQTAQCAMASAYEGWAYYMLKKFPESYTVFTKLLASCPQEEKALKSAQKGLRWISTISPGIDGSFSILDTGETDK